jgi:hypothetical protein
VALSMLKFYKSEFILAVFILNPCIYVQQSLALRPCLLISTISL